MIRVRPVYRCFTTQSITKKLKEKVKINKNKNTQAVVQKLFINGNFIIFQIKIESPHINSTGVVKKYE